MSASIGAFHALLPATTLRPPNRWAGPRSRMASCLPWYREDSASERFDVFVTVDRNLSYQQNVQALPIAIVVLHARANRLFDLLPLVPNLLAVIGSAKPGAVTTVSA